MSNVTSTSTGVPESTSTPQASTTSTSKQTAVSQSSSSIANNSPSPSGTTTSPITTSTTSTSIVLPTTTTTTTSTTPTLTPTTTTTTSTTPKITPTTTSAAPTTTPSPSVIISTVTKPGPDGSTSFVIITSTQNQETPNPTGSSSSSSSSAAPTASLQAGAQTTSSGLSSGGVIAVAVVVPIVGIALLVLAGLFFWRRRKERKDGEELRRKEVEEYGYNPNNDPTLPAVLGGGSASGDGPYEMREDGGAGYRGWGTTNAPSSGRKASTTLSGGQSAGGIGMAYSEGTSPTHGAVSDTRSDNPLVDRPLSDEIEPLGAMGPAASGNRSDINRGPSNASSQYSAAGRSDGSGEVPGGFGGQQYNNQYDPGNPYSETQYGSPPGRVEMPAQPVIRDVQARRNTRIENPAHFPQQSVGISQNF